MIALDTNVLIHANRGESPLHRVAHARVVELATGSAPWALPIVCLWGFVRVVTQSIFDPPTPVEQAMEFANKLVASPSARVLSPGPRHWSLLSATMLDARAGGRLLTDAVIVSLCREHGVDTVLSNDRDFQRFPQIRWEPLDAATSG